MGRGKKDREIVEQVPPLYGTGGQEGKLLSASSRSS